MTSSEKLKKMAEEHNAGAKGNAQRDVSPRQLRRERKRLGRKIARHLDEDTGEVIATMAARPLLERLAYAFRIVTRI